MHLYHEPTALFLVADATIIILKKAGSCEYKSTYSLIIKTKSSLIIKVVCANLKIVKLG